MYDFLYSDHERVASILAQSSGLGALVGNEHTSTKTRSSEKGGKMNVGVVGASAKGELNWSKDIRHAYDPLWMNSAKLIDLVSSEGKSESELDYGRLLTISGKLICMDQALFSNLLKSPAIIDQIAGSVETGSSQRSGKVQLKEKRGIADIIREFINSLPLGVVFTLFDGERAFWFNIKREYLQLQSLDIPLKFPAQIGGLWHVTGLIDALPQDHADIMSDIEAYGDQKVFSQAFPIITQMVVPVVGLFGRPFDTYGLSPIIIHREISL